MAKHTVVSMPGDGIGNQVLPEAIRVLDVVGFDVMEVSPPYDHADLTVNAAHRLIWEAFAALAVRNRASRTRAR